ncbi:hypothetical protein Ahy_B04g069135 [Arachis hypogaea]|uniref:Lysosomal Pro-X carboxypeptidase n=1 Tax=Arachis hypogaea TaxID=3818 RepID=A0A444ZBR5_ARAHY|nr:hypothetical protein Ahy_B04g069135 [Arachis hypogaea]
MYSLVSKWFFLIIFLDISIICVLGFRFPRLGIISQNTKMQYHDNSIINISYYTQRLDHFNYKPESSITFKQRYVIDFKNWGGSKSGAPIFVWFNGETSLEDGIDAAGILKDNALRFKAPLLYIEHRYYGKSFPFGSSEEALKNASTMGYLNSAQALADYAAILLDIRKTLNAHDSPIIVYGGSYVLAAWFRLKYPHIAYGALASSAPILYFDGVAPKHGYYYIVSKDFREISKSCYYTIQKSWNEIDEIAKRPHGLSVLSKRFKICKKLKNVEVLKKHLKNIYSIGAQYNQPSVESICHAIDEAANKTDEIGQIFQAFAIFNHQSNFSCYDIEGSDNLIEQSQDGNAWDWQTCSEIIVPISIDEDASMFQPRPFNMENYLDSCEQQYSVIPLPHWIITYYGGQDIKLVFKRFASNIIFSNGLKYPYSSGGVLESLSPSLIALTTVNGTHCLDILPAQQNDPKWLINQRHVEINIIASWIAEYQADRLIC